MKKLRLFYVPTEQANSLIQVFLRRCNRNDFVNKIIKNIVRNKLQKKYNVLIGDRCKIGENLYCPHPQNIVIGEKVIIGKDCVIYQDVTIGQSKEMYPKIGEKVIIYPGAKIFGDINIGDNVIIGANAVVNRSFGANKIIAGIPAKVIGENNNENEYY